MEDQMNDDIAVDNDNVIEDELSNDVSQNDEVSKLKETVRKLQSQKDQILNEKRELEKNLQAPKVENKVVTAPTPPQRPRNVYDQDEMENYLLQQEQYNRDLAIYNQNLLEEKLKPLKDYQQQIQTKEESAKLKATVIGQFQEVGASLELANTAYTLFADKANERTPEEWLIATKAILEHRRGGKKEKVEAKEETPSKGVANLNGVNEINEKPKLKKVDYFALK